MFDQAKYGQLSMFVMVPSCVPATGMATAGAFLEAKDISALQNDRWVLGLAEMMNYPGVVNGDPGVLEKILAFQSRVLDGHAPGVSGRALNAYVAAGIGSDHECTTLAEAQEKLRLGMYILVREATNAHNLKELLPIITPDNARRICFCTDDRHPADLLDEGSVDYLVRTAIQSARIQDAAGAEERAGGGERWPDVAFRAAGAPGLPAQFGKHQLAYGGFHHPGGRAACAGDRADPRPVDHRVPRAGDPFHGRLRGA
jgi:adenine deaminase